MKTAFRTSIRGAQDFLQNGSNVVSALMIVSLVVAVVALLPLGILFQVPAASTASIAPGGPVLSQRQEALKDQWIERRTAVALPQPFSRERQDALKEQWLAQRGAHANVDPATASQRQEALKDRWLERR